MQPGTSLYQYLDCIIVSQGMMLRCNVAIETLSHICYDTFKASWTALVSTYGHVQASSVIVLIHQ